MDANFNKILNVMYWVLIPLIMMFTTAVAFDGISSPSTFRVVLGFMTLGISGFTLYSYIRQLTEKLSNRFSKDNTNA